MSGIISQILVSHLVLLAVSSTTIQGLRQPIIESEKDLFYALTSLRFSDQQQIDNLLARNNRHVTPRLWDWLNNHASYNENANDLTDNQFQYIAILRIAYLLNDANRIAISYRMLGMHHLKHKKYTEALSYFELSLEYFRRARRTRERLFVEAERSRAYFLLGDIAQSRDIANNILLEAESIRNIPAPLLSWPIEHAIANALTILADIDLFNGQFDEALNKSLKVLQIYDELNESSLPFFSSFITRSLLNLGRIYGLIGNYRQSLLYYGRALDMARHRSDVEGEAMLLLNLGAQYLRQEDYDRSRFYLEQSLKLYSQSPDYSALSLIYLNLAIISYKTSDLDNALTHLRISHSYALKSSNTDALILSKQHLGAIYHEQGRYREALNEFVQSESIARKEGFKLREIEALWRQSETLISSGKIVEGIAKSRTVIQRAQQLHQPKLTHLAALTTAKGHLKLQQKDKALESLNLSIALLEEMRGNVSGEIISQNMFFSNRIEAYHLATNILVEQDRLLDAIVMAEQAKGRLLYDRLIQNDSISRGSLTEAEKLKDQHYNREISRINKAIYEEQLKRRPNVGVLNALKKKLDMLREQYTSYREMLSASHSTLKLQAKQPIIISLSNITALNGMPNVVILNFLVTKTQTLLFVVTASSLQKMANLQIHKINIPKDELFKRSRRLYSLLSQQHPSFNTEARALYELLLKPVEEQIRNIKTLCIIPDDVLWDLPFQALIQPDGRYLLEDHSIFYAPSLSILGELSWRRDSPDIRKPTSLLAFGNPKARKETTSQLQETELDFKFGPLPEAETEVRTISESFPPERKATYLGPAATEARFKAEAANFGIIHFATHGVIDNLNPLYSYLLLTSDDNDGEDGLLEAREILDLNLRADTVVLSACETARGRIGAGEGVIGMTWAFFAAGARTAIVSQWKVDSAATSDLMINFYRRFSQGANKAEAMREASLALLKDPRYHHPFYWASFIVVGSDR